MNSDTRDLLEHKLRDELNIIARKLRITGYRSLRKDDLVSAILKCDEQLVRRSLSVTWWDRYHNHVYGVVTVVALVFSIVVFAVSWMFPADDPRHVVVEPAAARDNLIVSKVRTIIDQPTVIHQFRRTGIMSVYWELTLSNNGTMDLSVIDYDIALVAEHSGPVSYTHMQQGIYMLEEGQLVPVHFPIAVAAGRSQAMFLKVGILMDGNAYTLVKTKFTAGGQANVKSIVDFLRLEETDFYGNAFTKQEAGIYALPPIDQIAEQVFGVSFETSRGAKTTEIISWYRYGLFRDQLAPK